MNLVLTQEGALLLWQYMLGIAVATIPKLHLFGSAYTPVHTDVLANFTPHELSVPGYSPLSLGAPGNPWSPLVIGQGAEMVNQPPPWTFGGACQVTGWYLTDAGNTKSLFAGVFSPPFTFNAQGGQFYIAVTPSLISIP